MRTATCHPERKTHGKGLCQTCYDKQWRKNNPEKWAAKLARRRQRGTDSEGHRKRKFGITPASFQNLKDREGNACAICRAPFSKTAFMQLPRVDHNHTTKKVRGLLCYACNSGIGFFKDDILRLQSAIKYLLERNGEDSTG
jgi:nitrate/TMAO reductase-like tetraheme cytochrome c subunit